MVVVYEALRILTKIEMETRSRHPAVKLAVLADLDQRITTRFTINGMDPAVTADYICPHLKAAGRTDTLFTYDALTALHHGSRGKCRAVNNLARPLSSRPTPPAKPSWTSPPPIHDL